MRNITRILYSTESYPYAMTASGRDEGGRGDQRRQPVSAPVTSSDTKCDPEHPATHHLRSGHQGRARSELRRPPRRRPAPTPLRSSIGHRRQRCRSPVRTCQLQSTPRRSGGQPPKRGGPPQRGRVEGCAARQRQLPPGVWRRPGTYRPGGPRATYWMREHPSQSRPAPKTRRTARWA